MDAERQPLLGCDNPDIRCRRFRPLTHEEVIHARQEVTWRRARFFIIIMFWAIMAMFLSIITCILVSAPNCNSDTRLPSVPPVHLTVASLIARGRELNDNKPYAL